ncbi:CGNR zinc finger domain-containing protein [Saccharopolyspora flava]|nr:CGNR zinc finger domain-containing protein [Saccharopolyspora flava]
MLAVPALEMTRVVEFVNEYADLPRAAADELETPYPNATEILAWPGHLPIPDTDDLVATANATFQVFSSAQDGHAFQELNDLLQSARPLPVASESGLCWTVEARTEVLPAALATCILQWLLNHEQARLGTCHGAKCVDAYADASPAGKRRFCSSTCLNRHKVAAYRQRAKPNPGTERN